MSLPRHPQVAGWLQNLDDTTRGEVDEALDYLQEHGRAAALPDVRHRIQISRHFPDMSEVRVDIDDAHLYRVLVGFGPNDVPALLLAGNKAGIGNHWYDENVPIADDRFDAYLAALARSRTVTKEP
ncbi:MAG: type II toxin-antitoxin system RelE/ParE family toxin [Acidimicrobiales bacterium]